MTVVNPTSDNTALWSTMLNAFANAHGAGGIVSGCSISKGTGDWDIDVTSGTIIEANTEADITAGTVTITDSSALTSGQSRVTLIHADTGDTIASTDGSAAADPASPDIPASEVLLGFVVVADTDGTVADSDIIDIPSLIQNINSLYKDGASHELDVADLAGGDGIANQIAVTDGSAVTWQALTAGIITANDRPYSTANDGSDITEHTDRHQGNSPDSQETRTLVNLTSTDGVLLGGFIIGDQLASPVNITADGGSTFTATIQTIDDSNGDGTPFAMLPPINFSSSLTVQFDIANNNSTFTAGVAWTR